MLRPSVSPATLTRSLRPRPRCSALPYTLPHLAIARLLSTSSSAPHTLAVLGSGLSGLSSAYYTIRSLSPEARERTRVVVLEKEDRTGGWCNAVRIKQGTRVGDGERLIQQGEQPEETLVFESGPRSIRPVGLLGWLTIELAHSLGMTPSLITVAKTAPSAKNRFLFTPPTLTMLPNSLPSLFKGLFTTPLLRRILPSAALEPFRPRSPAHDLPDGGDESVDAFFARRFGKPIAEEMASAMIHGIYSGDSRRLSVRAVFPQLWEAEREWGSVVLAGLLGGFARRRGWKNKSAWRVAKEKEDEEMEKVKSGLRASGKEGEELVGRTEGASVWGVRGGLQELTLALEERLRKEGVEFWMGEQGKVEKVEKVEGNWKITTSSSSLAATHLIATNPTVFASLSPPSFPSSTVSVINLAFPRPVPSSPPLFPPGFGYLIPRTVPLSQNPHHVLGIIFDSDVMPDVDSSYDKLVKITLITGGSYWLDWTKPLPQKTHEELVKGAMETLSLHFPHTTFPAPTHAFSHTHFDCIPQVPPGSLPAFKAFGERLRKAGNVAVVGGGFSAVGVNGCVKGGWEVGEAFGKAISRSVEGREGAARVKSEEAVETVKTGTEMWET